MIPTRGTHEGYPYTMLSMNAMNTSNHSLPPTISSAYTDAPDLHPNLVLGSLHLLFWLFFHPSAWRNYVARIDPTLRVDFSLAESGRKRWRNNKIRRLVIQTYFIYPITINLLIVIVSWFLGKANDGIVRGVS